MPHSETQRVTPRLQRLNIQALLKPPIWNHSFRKKKSHQLLRLCNAGLSKDAVSFMTTVTALISGSGGSPPPPRPSRSGSEVSSESSSVPSVLVVSEDPPGSTSAPEHGLRLFTSMRGGGRGWTPPPSREWRTVTRFLWHRWLRSELPLEECNWR